MKATIKQQKKLITKKILLLRNNTLTFNLIEDYLKLCKEQNKIISKEEFYNLLEKQFDALVDIEQK
jgi:uncharacterized protein (DUF2344 family)